MGGVGGQTFRMRSRAASISSQSRSPQLPATFIDPADLMAVLCSIQGMLPCATADIEHRSVSLACLDAFLIGLLWTTTIPRGKAQGGSIKISATWTTALIHRLLLHSLLRPSSGAVHVRTFTLSPACSDGHPWDAFLIVHATASVRPVVTKEALALFQARMLSGLHARSDSGRACSGR
jgi:hypothetical protein